jgi:hypothetical protein
MFQFSNAKKSFHFCFFYCSTEINLINPSFFSFSISPLSPLYLLSISSLSPLYLLSLLSLLTLFSLYFTHFKTLFLSPMEDKMSRVCGQGNNRNFWRRIICCEGSCEKLEPIELNISPAFD